VRGELPPLPASLRAAIRWFGRDWTPFAVPEGEARAATHGLRGYVLHNGARMPLEEYQAMLEAERRAELRAAGLPPDPGKVRPVAAPAPVRKLFPR
jgi:hypothetical protein